MEEQATAYRTHENDGNTQKRQQREHTSFHSRVAGMFSSLLAHDTADLLASSCVEDESHLYLKEPVIDTRRGTHSSGVDRIIERRALRAACNTSKKVP